MRLQNAYLVPIDPIGIAIGYDTVADAEYAALKAQPGTKHLVVRALGLMTAGALVSLYQRPPSDVVVPLYPNGRVPVVGPSDSCGIVEAIARAEIEEGPDLPWPDAPAAIAPARRKKRNRTRIQFHGQSLRPRWEIVEFLAKKYGLAKATGRKGQVILVPVAKTTAGKVVDPCTGQTFDMISRFLRVRGTPIEILRDVFDLTPEQLPTRAANYADRKRLEAKAVGLGHHANKRAAKKRGAIVLDVKIPTRALKKKAKR